jgi:hypothetical protein
VGAFPMSSSGLIAQLFGSIVDCPQRVSLN